MKKLFLYQLLLVLTLMFCAQELMAQTSGVISVTPNPASIAAGYTTANVTASFATFGPGGQACLNYVRVSPSYASGGSALCGSSGSQVYPLGAGTYQFMLMRVSDFSVLDIVEVTVTGP